MKKPYPIIIHVFTVLLCVIVGVSYAEDYTSPENIDRTTRIDAEGLIKLAEDNKLLIIIDSRIRSDRNQGFIPGSISLPDTETNCESLSSIIADKTRHVVFYCNGPKCRRSDNAVVIAANCGYESIYWFRDGIEAWRATDYPIVK